jgi:antitoxin component YwqK of YwqJK toxin-antitoxin module
VLDFGKGKEYLEKGTLVYDGEWKNGKRNGKGMMYVENGTLVSEYAFFCLWWH